MNVLDMMVGIHAGRTLTILCIVCFGQDGILSVMSGLGNIASYQNLIAMAEKILARYMLFCDKLFWYRVC